MPEKLQKTEKELRINDSCFPHVGLSGVGETLYSDIAHAAPLLGGDNYVVFKDFLGLSENEFDAYAAKEAFN